MPNNKQAIYVTLDALLDTRLGTVARISDSAAEELLRNRYHERDTDVFQCVDMEQYKQLYAARDVETLAKSVCTNMMLHLTHLSGVLAEQAITRPYHDGGKIVVNYYPYQLSDEEQDQIGRAIGAWIKDAAPVELTYIPPEDLTPDHCKRSYAMMIVYDYEAWMDFHAKAFEKTRLPEVIVLAPALYFNRKPTEEELARELRESTHPFRAIEFFARPLFELKLIDVKYFSMISGNT